MFIKFRIFHCWLFLLLIVCVILELYVSKSTGENTCHESRTSTNSTFKKNDEGLSYTVFKKGRCPNTLRAVINNVYKKSKCYDNVSQKIIKNKVSVLEKNASFKKNEFGIEATLIHNGGDSARIADSFHTESSFLSSQFDNVLSSELSDDGLKTDLSDNSNETFHADSETAVNEQIEQKDSDVESRTSQETNAEANETDIKLPIEPTQEDIPSFREWTEKHLAEKERERADDNITNVPGNGKNHKMRNKNFASLDCGAKVVGTNPEAKSTGSLLSMSRDEYLLSVCNSKIWFVVELCEAVQLKRIELANFELFSSSPKEFSVLIADRFPARDWTVVGQFTAKDEKSIQSFDLQPHHFTKFIKVEFHSHYGKEHFCPISLFRVYGTSEFEVLETVDENEEQDTDTAESDYDANEPIMNELDGKKRKLDSNNLFGSAKEAVMNIVKKAAEVLVISPSHTDVVANNTQLSNATSPDIPITLDLCCNCVTPRYVILCRDCQQNFFHKLYRLISCKVDDLNRMLRRDLIWKPLIKYNVCLTFGITSFYLRDHATALAAKESFRHNEMYPLYLFPREMIAALCNLAAISENRLKQNMTMDEALLLNQTKRCDGPKGKLPTYQTLYPIQDGVSLSNIDSKSSSSNFKIVENTVGMTYPQDSQSIAAKIKPTRTGIFDGDAKIKVQPQAPAVNEFSQPATPLSSSIHINVPTFPDIANSEQIKSVPEESEVLKEPEHPVEIGEDSMSLDSLISELEKTEAQQEIINSVPTATPKPTMQKESVFVRLANRIKALERNMSLSGQYLEELSRRYKKQVEDMQRVLSETVGRETKRTQELSLLAVRISELTIAVETLLAERESWSYKAILVGEHSLIIFLEIVIFIVIVCLCRGIPRVEFSKRKFSLEWRRGEHISNGADKSSVAVKRRQSLDDLRTIKSVQQHKRRPSEEAIKVDGGTHQDLLIYETNRSSKAESRRRKRKRKELLLKSNANAINLETGNLTKKLAPNKTNAPLSRSASASEIDEHSWGRHMYSGVDGGGQRLIEQKENLTLQDENDFSLIFKTATSVRKKRLSGQFNGKSLLSPVYDVSSDQDSSVPTTPIKEKKINGIKKIVKKFF